MPTASFFVRINIVVLSGQTKAIANTMKKLLFISLTLLVIITVQPAQAASTCAWVNKQRGGCSPAADPNTFCAGAQNNDIYLSNFKAWPASTRCYCCSTEIGCCLFTNKSGGGQTSATMMEAECYGNFYFTSSDPVFVPNKVADGGLCVVPPAPKAPIVPSKQAATDKSLTQGILDAATSKSKGDVNVQYDDLYNPLGTTIPAVVIGRVVNFVFTLIGTLALVFIIYAGIIWMNSRGNDAKIKIARNMLLWTTAGVIVIFMAYVLVRFVFQLVGK